MFPQSLADSADTDADTGSTGSPMPSEEWQPYISTVVSARSGEWTVVVSSNVTTSTIRASNPVRNLSVSYANQFRDPSIVSDYIVPSLVRDYADTTIEYGNGVRETFASRDVRVNTSQDGTTTISGIRIGSSATSWSTGSGSYLWPPMSANDRYRAAILRNMSPDLDARNGALMAANGHPAEMKARKLLRDLIGEKQFRRYMVRGFIVCQGSSGVFYRIHGGSGMVYSLTKNSGGKLELFEKFCVQFKDPNLPFTDSVIMRKLLVENDEFALRSVGVVSKALPESRIRSVWEPVPLVA